MWGPLRSKNRKEQHNLRVYFGLQGYMAVGRKTAEPSLQAQILSFIFNPSMLLPWRSLQRASGGRDTSVKTYSSTTFLWKECKFSVFKRKTGLLGLHGNLDLFHPSLSSPIPPLWHTAVCYGCLELSVISWISFFLLFLFFFLLTNHLKEKKHHKNITYAFLLPSVLAFPRVPLNGQPNEKNITAISSRASTF